MRNFLLRAALLSASALLLHVPSASAGNGFDRTDLIDVNDEFSATVSAPTEQSSLSLEVDESNAQAEGEIVASDGMLRGRIEWEIYEPDKVARSAKKVDLSQGNQVAIGLSTEPAGGGDSTSILSLQAVPGCKAKVSASDTSRSGDGDADAAAWSVQCSSGAFDGRVSDEDLDTLAAIFQTRQFKFSGRVTGDNEPL